MLAILSLGGALQRISDLVAEPRQSACCLARAGQAIAKPFRTQKYRGSVPPWHEIPISARPGCLFRVAFVLTSVDPPSIEGRDEHRVSLLRAGKCLGQGCPRLWHEIGLYKE